MAKAKRIKSEPAPVVSGAASLLDVAWRAYEAGDTVLARRAARLVLAGASRDADEAVAKKVSKLLFVGVPDADARQVATELNARTKVALRPYLFALMAAAIWLFMIVIANRT